MGSIRKPLKPYTGLIVRRRGEACTVLSITIMVDISMLRHISQFIAGRATRVKGRCIPIHIMFKISLPNPDLNRYSKDEFSRTSFKDSCFNGMSCSLHSLYRAFHASEPLGFCFIHEPSHQSMRRDLLMFQLRVPERRINTTFRPPYGPRKALWTLRALFEA